MLWQMSVVDSYTGLPLVMLGSVVATAEPNRRRNRPDLAPAEYEIKNGATSGEGTGHPQVTR